MCGIVTIFAYREGAGYVDHDELRLIRATMKARGPDGSGEWFSDDGRVGIGHRRLSIIDLSESGAQPMQSSDGRVVISFNGEIYNYRELRKELEQHGRVFRSHSDTEVLLHLYEEKGDNMVHDLRGMFAFALWDDRKRALMLARDPYGIKPLYYSDDGATFRVASQVKALLASNKLSRTPEPAGLVGFFLMGSVPEPFTFYRDIHQVPAGSFLWVTSQGVAQPQSYFSIAKAFQRNGGQAEVSRDEEIKTAIREALIDSVRHHFVADVPVGIFLSSGIDSGSLLAIARDAGVKDLTTITLAFREFQGTAQDEAPLAEEVARRYGTNHHTYVLEEAEFLQDLPKVLEAMDQPSIDGINTYFVSKAAKRMGLKVALSGLGGDELFGGYPSFREIPILTSALRIPTLIPFLGDGFRHAFSFFALPKRWANPKYAGLLKYGGSYAGAYLLRRGLFMPWELPALMDREMTNEGLSQLSLLARFQQALEQNSLPSFARVATLEASFYMRNQLLRDADWAGMAHSLEIRTPYVDAILLKTLAPLLSGLRTKAKDLLANSPNVPLPDSILKRAKTGFTVPIEKWLEANKWLDAWRNIPRLASSNCHWSRRWAYTLYRTFFKGTHSVRTQK